MAKRRIVVPVDLNSESDPALNFASHIAARLDAMISCIYVIEEPDMQDDKPLGTDTKHRLRRNAENKLSEKVNSILKDDVKAPFEIIVTSGEVYQKILEKSLDLNAQLIVMRRSNFGGLDKNRIGSVTKHILAKSKVPVFAISMEVFLERKHIVLPLDLLKPIGSQIQCAIDSARLLEADISVISVLEEGMSYLNFKYLDRLEEINLLVRELGIRCESRLLENRTSISAEILSFTKNIYGGMILISTSQEKNCTSSYIGSVAQEIIEFSDVPVQCISPNYTSGFSIER